MRSKPTYLAGARALATRAAGAASWAYCGAVNNGGEPAKAAADVRASLFSKDRERSIGDPLTQRAGLGGGAANCSLAKALIWLFLLGLGLTAAPGWAATAVLLDANFNDKPLNAPIGTGGPSVGEPIFVDPALQATVRDTLFTSPSLNLRNLNGSINPVHRAAFALVGDAEVQHGLLRIAFRLRAPSTLTTFAVYIRERVSAASEYSSLFFTKTGTINSIDEAGTLANLSNFSPNETLRVEYLYNLGAGTYDLFINNVLLIDNRAHGVTDPSSGIGILSFAPSENGTWAVDDILVTHTTPNTLLLEADFNDKPLNTQIGTGGPIVGEPTTISSGLSAVVRNSSLGSRSLHMSQSTITAAKNARFEFLDGDQARAAELLVSFVVRTPPVLDTFRVRLRQPSSSGDLFGGIEFNASGQLRTLDAPSGNTTLLNYAANQTLQFTLVYQVAAGTYDIYVDGNRVLHEGRHGVSDPERGIGAIDVGLTGNSSQTWIFDDLLVRRLPHLLDADFNDEAIGQQIQTNGALNGQPVSINAGLIAQPRINLFPTPALAVTQGSTGLARLAIFEFIQQAEIANGELRIGMRVLPPTVNDRFTVSIHERGGLSTEYGSLSFLSNGDVRLFDAGGSQVLTQYLPGVSQQFEFRYRLDEGKYDVYVDRALAVLGRPIASGPGIGRITLGTAAATSRTWVVDDLQVYRLNDRGNNLFANGFE